jgi:hypothetical protein
MVFFLKKTPMIFPMINPMDPRNASYSERLKLIANDWVAIEFLDLDEDEHDKKK